MGAETTTKKQDIEKKMMEKLDVVYGLQITQFVFILLLIICLFAFVYYKYIRTQIKEKHKKQNESGYEDIDDHILFTKITNFFKFKKLGLKKKNNIETLDNLLYVDHKQLQQNNDSLYEEIPIIPTENAVNSNIITIERVNIPEQLTEDQFKVRESEKTLNEVSSSASKNLNNHPSENIKPGSSVFCNEFRKPSVDSLGPKPTKPIHQSSLPNLQSPPLSKESQPINFNCPKEQETPIIIIPQDRKPSIEALGPKPSRQVVQSPLNKTQIHLVTTNNEHLRKNSVTEELPYIEELKIKQDFNIDSNI